MVPGTPEGTSFTEHDHLLHGKRPRRRVSKPILPLRQPRRKLMFNINKILRTRKCRSKSELFLRPEFQDAFLIAAGDILSYTTFELSPIPQFFSLAGENDLAERRACMNVTIQRTELAVVRDTPPFAPQEGNFENLELRCKLSVLQEVRENFESGVQRSSKNKPPESDIFRELSGRFIKIINCNVA